MEMVSGTCRWQGSQPNRPMVNLEGSADQEKEATIEEYAKEKIWWRWGGQQLTMVQKSVFRRVRLLHESFYF
jgi:hypothetical protein